MTNKIHVLENELGGEILEGPILVAVTETGQLPTDTWEMENVEQTNTNLQSIFKSFISLVNRLI